MNLQITDGTQPAQLLLMLQLENSDRTQAQHFAVVRYLMEDDISTYDLNSPEYYNINLLNNMKGPFKLYKWEYEIEIQGRRRLRRLLSPTLIDMTTIVSNAFLAPYHCSKNILPVCKVPKFSDRFWYVDRKFFDRSGWDTVTTINPDDYIIPGVPNIIEENLRIGSDLDSDGISDNSDDSGVESNDDNDD